MARTATVSFQADLANMRKELKKLPGMTEAEAKRMVKGFTSQMKKAEAASKKAWKASKRGAQDFGDQLASVEDLMDGIGAGPLSDVARQLRYLSIGSKELGKGFAVATVGSVALGAAVVGVGAGIVAAVRNAEDLRDELEDFADVPGFELLTAEQVATLERANASLDALGTVAKAVVVTLGGELAPVVEKSGTVIVAMALMSKDLFSGLDAGRAVIKDLAIDITDKLIQALLGGVTGIVDMLGLLGKAASALGMEGLGGSLQDVNAEYDAWTRNLAKGAVENWVTGSGEAIRWYTDGLGGYMGQAEQLISVQTEVNRTGEEGAKTTKKQTAAIKDLERAAASLQSIRMRAQEAVMGAEERILHLRDVELAKIDELAAKVGASVEVEAARYAVLERAEHQLSALRQQQQEQAERLAEEMHERELARIEAEQAARFSATQTFLGGWADLAQTTADTINESNADAARKWFTFYKLAAVAQIQVDAAAAIMKAFATLGPIGGAIASAGIVGTATAQTMAVTSQRLPTFHTGLVGGAPDETPAVIRRGERVLTRPQQDAMGGPKAVDAAASGGGIQSLLAVWKIDHKVIGTSLYEHLRTRSRRTIEALERAQPRTGRRVPAAYGVV